MPGLTRHPCDRRATTLRRQAPSFVANALATARVALTRSCTSLSSTSSSPSYSPRVARAVAFVQDAPDFRTETQRMRQDLEHDVAIGGSKARDAEGREAEGVACVVSEVESAFERELRIRRILEPSHARAHEPARFVFVRWLLPQRFPRAAEIFKSRGHAGPPLVRSARSSVGPALAAQRHCPAWPAWRLVHGCTASDSPGARG